MTLELVLGIASFFLALAGLIANAIAARESRPAFVAVVFVALIATTTVALVQGYRHARQLDRTEEQIVAALRGGTRTIDDLNDLLHNVDRRLLIEALFRAVDQDRVEHEIIEFSTASGGFSRVRGYGLPEGPAQDARVELSERNAH